jgi:uncharacterized protein
MKKQNFFLQRLLIALTILSPLFFAIHCSSGNGNKNTTDGHQSEETKQATPKTDIHSAILAGDLQSVQQHIAAGSDLNVKDPLGGSSPLITACLFGKTEIARALIAAKADLNFRNNDGSTPLHTAAFFCRPEIVKLLLDAGADRTIKNKYNQTPYEIVAGPFDSVKQIYEDLEKALAPMGLTLDYPYLEKTRPAIASMLK